MSIIGLIVDSINISFTQNFEQQGFAVTEVTGLSEYGEHVMGMPGDSEIQIKGCILPGVNPLGIRSYIYGSANPYTKLTVQTIHSPPNNNVVLQATALIKSVKCDIHTNPSSIEVTLIRQGGWYGKNVSAVLNQNFNSSILEGSFEFLSPINMDIQLLTPFSQEAMLSSTMSIHINDESSIGINFNRILPIVSPFSAGLNGGSIIRVETSLDYNAHLYTANRMIELPVLGDIKKGMMPVSVNPHVTLETSLAQGCLVEVVINARETFLTT